MMLIFLFTLSCLFCSIQSTIKLFGHLITPEIKINDLESLERYLNVKLQEAKVDVHDYKKLYLSLDLAGATLKELENLPIFFFYYATKEQLSQLRENVCKLTIDNALEKEESNGKNDQDDGKDESICDIVKDKLGLSKPMAKPNPPSPKSTFKFSCKSLAKHDLIKEMGSLAINTKKKFEKNSTLTSESSEKSEPRTNFEKLAKSEPILIISSPQSSRKKDGYVLKDKTVKEDFKHIGKSPMNHDHLLHLTGTFISEEPIRMPVKKVEKNDYNNRMFDYGQSNIYSHINFNGIRSNYNYNNNNNNY